MKSEKIKQFQKEEIEQREKIANKQKNEKIESFKNLSNLTEIEKNEMIKFIDYIIIIPWVGIGKNSKEIKNVSFCCNECFYRNNPLNCICCANDNARYENYNELRSHLVNHHNLKI